MNNDDVVVLSDSDTSIDYKKEELKSDSYEKESDLSDFDAKFPRISINGLNVGNIGEKSRKENSLNDDDYEDILPTKQDQKRTNDRNYLKNQNVRKNSQSDSDYETEKVNNYYDEYIKALTTKHQVNVTSSPDEDEKPQTQTRGRKNGGKTKKISEEEKRKKQEEREQNRIKKQQAIDEEKRKKQEEKEQNRIRKLEEANRKKAMKELNSKNRLVSKPEHSMKFMKVIVDDGIEKMDFFTEFLKNAGESEVTYTLESQLIPNSISWKRKVENNYLNDKHEVCSDVQLVDEGQIILIWTYEEAVRHIHENTIISSISNLKSLLPDKKLTIVLYKMENYFKHYKNLKDRALQDEIANGFGEERQRKKTKNDKTFSSLPKISRKKFEECLVEIEIRHNVSSRLIETPAEIVLLIHQYTKSLAVLPTKLEKNKEAAKFDWYVDCDNRDTVKVDKSGNGLKRLWQQQLCQFPLVSLEAAEAISSVYKSPLQLMNAYANCTPAEGEKLLKELPIRRGAGPISSVRKIGQELSRKVYLMFTSKDGEIYLNDQET